MTGPDPLTSRDYWEHLYQTRQRRRDPWHRPVRRWLSRGFHSHKDLVLSHVLGRYLPRQGRLVEIGCAPGEVLLALCTRFGLEPFGIEYSDIGYRATVDEFERQQVDARGVMRGDIIDPVFRHRYREHFDVVFSAGFIEHFANPTDVVGYHFELLKPGGQLVILIPNLRALLYKPILGITCPDVLAIHNLSIMRRSEFHALFTNHPVNTHYCNYLGMLELGLMFRPNTARFSLAIQAMFDVLLINILQHHDLHNRFTSPSLLYVGTKHRRQE